MTLWDQFGWLTALGLFAGLVLSVIAVMMIVDPDPRFGERDVAAGKALLGAYWSAWFVFTECLLWASSYWLLAASAILGVAIYTVVTWRSEVARRPPVNPFPATAKLKFGPRGKP